MTIFWVAAPALAYARLPWWIGVPVGIVLSLRALNCLSQVTHMSVHGTLLRNRPAGNILGDLCAYALGYTLYIRKQTHLEHHRWLNTVNDPDRTWGPPDQTPAELLRGILGDLLGVSIVQKAIQYYAVERRHFSRSFEVRGIVKFVVGLCGVQGLVIAWYWVVAGLPAYLFLFVWPMATLYPALIRLRSFVEHNLEDGHEGWLSRTIRPSILERFIMAPGYQSFHFEHHLHPDVPLYHLPRLHAYLVDRGAVAVDPRGYLGYVLSRLR